MSCSGRGHIWVPGADVSRRWWGRWEPLDQDLMARSKGEARVSGMGLGNTNLEVGGSPKMIGETSIYRKLVGCPIGLWT